MLEARAHHHLKELLRREGGERWPHHLTLCRLVGRSLRRQDHTLIRLSPGTDPSWWISLLVPLALSDSPVALVVGDERRRRLLQVEWPRLEAIGLPLPCWQGPGASAQTRLWLLNHRELVEAWQAGQLGNRQLVIPELEGLELGLREALSLRLETADWERLCRSHPPLRSSLLSLHGRLGERLLQHPRAGRQPVPVAVEDEAPLRHLLALVQQPLPAPWDAWLAAGEPAWTTWARVEPALLSWQLVRQPLEPLAVLEGLLKGRGAVMAGELAGDERQGRQPLTAPLGLEPQVTVSLGDPPLADALPVYAPLRQPLPNSPHFPEHLLDHARRLVLGQAGLTVVLVDDERLRHGLASGLAAEFGSRVTVECTSPDDNGVLCSSWAWWLEHQQRLPLPIQVVVALLPIASLEDPLTAARVQALRQQGRDWFRELLLPEALTRLQQGLAGLRRRGGRLAVLDGRLRSRSWGRQVFQALEPWVQLARLLPS